MKKLSLFVLCLAAMISLNGFGQDKDLSIEEAINGQVLRAANKNYQWRAELDYITYVENHTLFQMKAGAKSKPEVVMGLDKMNEVLEASGLGETRYFPAFNWKDINSFYFFHRGYLVYYDLVKHVIADKIKLDQQGAGFEFSIANKKYAYTIGNNVFLYEDQKGENIQVTFDENQNIVNGQTVSRSEFGINKGLFWSPNANYLAFYKKDEGKVREYPIVNVSTRIAEVEPLKYPMAGLESEEVFVGIYNLETGNTLYINERAFSKERYLTNVSWGPEEKYIYIAVLNREQNHMKLNQYDVNTGLLVKTLFEEKAESFVEPLSGPLFIPGKSDEFIWLSNRNGYNHAYQYKTDGTLVKQLTSGAFDLDEIIGFDAKSRNLFYTSREASPLESNVYKLDLTKGTHIRLSEAPGTHTIRLSASGKYFIDSYSNYQTPRNIELCDTRGKNLKQLFAAEDRMKERGLPTLDTFKIKAADGTTDLYGNLILPKDFDPSKKYPVIIYVYGGPHSQLVYNTWHGGARGWQFYMAQKGYIGMPLDNRGTSHRGRAFEEVIHRRLGEIERADQMEGVKYLKSLPFVDAKRIGVHGWSYGGFMTTGLMLHHPDVFKVGVAGGPVIDWKYYEVMYGERYMDMPQENEEGYEKSALTNYVDQLEGKLLLIHGAIDNTVVWQNSMVFLRKCVEEGKLVDYMVYPRHQHNVRGKDRIHLMRKVTQYFEDNL